MRKLSLLVCSSLVLLATTGLGAQAAWASDPEPDCSGQPDGIRGFHVLTVPNTGGSIADVYGGAALCGTNVDFLRNIHGGYSSGYILTAGDMDAKNGPTMRCANPVGDSRHRAYCSGTDLPSGAYVGSADTHLEQCFLGALCSFNPTNSDMWVYDAGTANPPIRDSRCKNVATAVQCFQGTDWLGLGTTDVVVQPCWAVRQCREAVAGIANLDPYEDRYFMTINPVDTLISGTEAYYTAIGEPKYKHPTSDPDPDDMHICGRANLSGAATCGTNDADWVQKNPPTGTYACSGTKPEGYAARATTWGSLSAVPDTCYPYTWT